MDIEHEIRTKGANVGPRITPADIEENIASEYYFTAADGMRGLWGDSSHLLEDDCLRPASPLHLLTFCVLILRNGHRIVGVNEGPVSAENFDAKLGRKLARQKAIDQIWSLMGYELRSRLERGEA